MGTHKTGTTTIQNLLHANRRALSARGVLYPDPVEDFGGDPRLQSSSAHFRFASALAEPWSPAAARLPAFRGRLERELERHEAVILSAESMYRHIRLPAPTQGNPAEPERREGRRAYLDALAGYLAGLEVEVVVYFRRPDSFAESMYQESVCNSASASLFDGFLRGAAERFDYVFQFGLLQERFPVRAFGFEEAARGGLVEHFFSALGLGPAPLATDGRMRASVPKRATQWLVRHKRGGDTEPRSRKRRWLFALQARHRDLFAAPAEASFWPSAAARDAFLRWRLRGFDAAAFPPASPGLSPLPDWTDEDHARAEATFAAWEGEKRREIARREKDLLDPYIDPELD